MERGKTKKSDILRNPGSSKSIFGLDGSSNSTKSHDSEKNEKVTKSAPKTDHTGGGKIDKATPFSAELVVWWCQLAKMCDLADPQCEKGAQRVFKSPKNGPGRKNTQKILPGSCPKETQRSTRARKITRGNKNTTERHNRAAGSPKT